MSGWRISVVRKVRPQREVGLHRWVFTGLGVTCIKPIADMTPREENYVLFRISYKRTRRTSEDDKRKKK